MINGWCDFRGAAALMVIVFELCPNTLMELKNIIIINNNLSKNTIYYIHDSEIIELVKNNQSNYNLIKLEDNLLFLIPNK